MAKNEPDLGDYTDYLLLSSSDFSKGWKHNIMRLAPASASDVTDPNRWTASKLNRRDMRRVRREEEEMAQKAQETAENGGAAPEGAAASGAAGVEGGAAGGGSVPRAGMPGFMVKKEKEERDESLVAPGPAGTSSAAAAAALPRPRRGFGAPKKTKRVYITEESTKNRRIAFEEQHPWVLETTDDGKPASKTRWIGKMDAGASAAANGGEGSSYALFVLDDKAGSEAAFKVIPANRWYKFTSRPKYHVLNGEEVEEEYKRMQKAGDMDSWFSHRRALPGSANAASANSASAGRLARGTDSFQGTGHALSGGYSARFAQARAREDDQVPRSKLKTVIGDRAANDADLFGDEEPAGPSQRRAGKSAVRPRRRQGLEDDQYEEFEFEAEFQDDEEGIGQVGDDVLEADENKELEERIKRELRGANHLEGEFGAGVESADEDDGIATNLTKAGRKVKKLLKKKGRKGRPEDEEDDFDEEDDDDDDEDRRNPYASDDGAEDDTDSEAEREEARRKQQRAQYQQQAPSRPTGPNVPGGLSRTGSAGPGLPRYPGSENASRAPSTGPASRAASPQPGNLSRRATSPSLTGKPGSRAASPTPPPSATKRKASDDANSPHGSETAAAPAAASGGSKRRKPGSPSPAPVPVAPGDDSALIAREEIIAFIRQGGKSTKELLKHFKVAMARDPRNREIILNVTREVATITEGKLSLKSEAAAAA